MTFGSERSASHAGGPKNDRTGSEPQDVDPGVLVRYFVWMSTIKIRPKTPGSPPTAPCWTAAPA